MFLKILGNNFFFEVVVMVNFFNNRGVAGLGVILILICFLIIFVHLGSFFSVSSDIIVSSGDSGFAYWFFGNITANLVLLIIIILLWKLGVGI